MNGARICNGCEIAAFVVTRDNDISSRNPVCNSAFSFEKRGNKFSVPQFHYRSLDHLVIAFCAREIYGLSFPWENASFQSRLQFSLEMIMFCNGTYPCKIRTMTFDFGNGSRILLVNLA